MADTVSESDIADFLTNAAWVVRSTYHTALKTSPGAAIFGRGMLQKQTDNNTRPENASRIDWDYQSGDKVLLRKHIIIRKTECRYESDPWTITSVHTNDTIRVQRGTKPLYNIPSLHITDTLHHMLHHLFFPTRGRYEDNIL
eukprot:CCRYP_007285-RA/>CCRYP_007285-RA protein AED:0.61 eAED:0.56 QI:0/0/0/0.66/0/0/3/0/141